MKETGGGEKWREKKSAKALGQFPQRKERRLALAATDPLLLDDGGGDGNPLAAVGRSPKTDAGRSYGDEETRERRRAVGAGRPRLLPGLAGGEVP
jgi:hypothetical protein